MTTNRAQGRESGAAPLRTEGIDHIALEVEDPVASGRWYMALLGLERRFEEAWGDVPYVVGAGMTSLAFFARKPGASGLPREDLAPGSGHIAFRVDGETFERAPGLLAERGIEYREADYRISRSLHFEDPDGLHLELTTYEVT